MTIIESRLVQMVDPPFDYDSVALTRESYDKYFEIARRLFQRSTGKAATLDAADEDAPIIREWLRTVPLSGQVIVLWIEFREGIRCDYNDFVSNYDDLWYPGSDDTWIINAEATVLLEMDHEEQFSWRDLTRNSGMGS